MTRTAPDSRALSSTVEVMQALGGIGAVAELTGSGYSAAENWSRSETFPARFFLVMWLELLARGFSAPPSLWKQDLGRNKEGLLAILARKVRQAA